MVKKTQENTMSIILIHMYVCLSKAAGIPIGKDKNSQWTFQKGLT